MKKYMSILAISFLVFLSTGCFFMMIPEKDRDLGSGRYRELAERMESSIRDLAAAGNSELLYLCQCYSKLKQYNKLFSCADYLEKNVKKGDSTRPIEAGGTAAHFPFFNVAPFPYLFRAEAYIEIGAYDKAIASSRTAYEMAQSADWHRVDRLAFWDKRCAMQALGFLALAHALNGDQRQASSYVKELEEMKGPLGFHNAIVEMEKSLSLARAYMALGEYQKILAHKQELLYAFATFTNIIFGGSMSGDALFAFAELPKQFMINKALYETGHIREAKEGYDKLLDNASIGFHGELYWPILSDRGMIAETEGSMEEAIEYYKKAIDAIERQRSTIHTEAARIGFVGDKQKVYHQIIAALYNVGRIPEAFSYVERSKSRALVDLLASKLEFKTRGETDDTTNALLQQLNTVEAENCAVDLSSINTERASQRNARSIAIRKELETEAPDLATLVTVPAVSARDIQSRIKPDETIVEYYYNSDDLYAFVLTRGDLKAVRLQGAHLGEDVEALRKFTLDSNSTHVRGISEKLNARLFKPLEPYVKTPEIIIVAHGVLHYLPFGALQSEGQYLIDHYRLSHVPSASLIGFFKKERKVQQDVKILLIGNPDLGNPRYDLHYAELESKTISNLYPHSRMYLRNEASKSVFLREASHYDYIHFATHGIFREDSPLSSGIFLAGNGKEDGFMSVNELFSLDLNCDLVTLSACETGLGKVSNGDDVVGFARGFFYAGADSIVSSLWKVDDLATCFLMTEFYANLRRMDKKEALRQAQLAAKKKYDSPYYWAAFQLTGRGD